MIEAQHDQLLRDSKGERVGCLGVLLCIVLSIIFTEKTYLHPSPTCKPPPPPQHTHTNTHMPNSWKCQHFCWTFLILNCLCGLTIICVGENKYAFMESKYNPKFIYKQNYSVENKVKNTANSKMTGSHEKQSEPF